jgi:DNA-binding NarL/FixJ family response regulator
MVTVRALRSMQLEEVLEHVNVPSYVIDRGGVIRWVNLAARNIVGDVRGRQFTSVVAPEETRRAKELFARKIIGTSKVTDARLSSSIPTAIASPSRSAPCRSSTAIMSSASSARVTDLVERPHEHQELRLTPRQAEVLDLLERGRSTRQIAEELHLSIETVRNHIRHLLRAMGAHSRLEAVAIANQTY